MRKVILITLSALIVLIGILPRSVLAAPSVSAPAAVTATDTWYNQSFQEFFIKVYDPNFSAPNEIFGERYTAAQVQWVIYSLFSFVLTAGQPGNAEIVSCAMSGNAGTCIQGSIDNLKKLIPPGYFSDASGSQPRSFLAVVTSNPISGIGYVSGLIQRFHIVPVAYAQQGFGYTQNGFVQNLWRISRNISYALLIVAVIILSFMIMFRIKISPQVVISVQSALPKIVIALILITFSYAIAGFLIDLMYVVIGLLATILTTTWGPGLKLSGWDWPHMFSELTNADIFWVLVLYFLSFLITDITLIASAGIIYALLGLIFCVLMIFLLIIYSIRILIMMFKTFLNIIILIITAPFSILAGTVMQGAGFGPWLRNLISNLLVYPVVGAMLFFANFFLAIAGSSTLGGVSSVAGLYYLNPLVTKDILTNGSWWDPPLSTGFDAGYGLSMRGVLMLAASWIIMSMVPKAAELVKSIVAGKEFGGESAMGEASGIISGVAQPFERSINPAVATPAQIVDAIASFFRRH